ncbi:hypothetical protein B0A58_00910 [Flavobacterium branchiophilum NBRC 15030 = ATCC 35035]|nr:hypothetical protein B0A58_00910 [Flavobacterium branchiophilum NBRC 15030 = ATCC 35035]
MSLELVIDKVIKNCKNSILEKINIQKHNILRKKNYKLILNIILCFLKKFVFFCRIKICK